MIETRSVLESHVRDVHGRIAINSPWNVFSIHHAQPLPIGLYLMHEDAYLCVHTMRGNFLLYYLVYM